MKRIKYIAALAPACLFAWFASPALIAHGSSAAFDMAIGVPIALAFAGLIGAMNGWH